MVVDVRREINALREARGLGIPTVCLIDTDGDPDLVDIPIPGNDDSMRSIEVVIRELCESVSKGKSGVGAADTVSAGAPGEDAAARSRRRSSRSQFRADEGGTDAAAASDAEPAPAALPPPVSVPAPPVATTTSPEPATE